MVKRVTTRCFDSSADFNFKVSGVYRTAARDVAIGAVRINAGDRVYANISKANVDVSEIPYDDRLYSQRF